MTPKLFLDEGSFMWSSEGVFRWANLAKLGVSKNLRKHLFRSETSYNVTNQRRTNSVSGNRWSEKPTSRTDHEGPKLNSVVGL